MKLFATVNDLLVASGTATSRHELSSGVIDLIHYARLHFAEEEALMESADYPRQAEQRIAHADFSAEVTRAAAYFFAERSTSIESLVLYVRGWLEDHVMTLDRDLAEHLRAIDA
jgi:hemerythrin-like metal-binding protein